MRILVTGDRGYLGSVLVPMLQRAGHSVVGLDIGGFSGCPPHTSAPRYEQRTADAYALQSVDLAGFEAVIHLANVTEESPAPVSGTQPDNGRPGAADVLALAERTRQAGVGRFIFLAVCDLVEQQDASTATITSLLGLYTEQTFLPIVLTNAAPYGYSSCMRLDTVLNGTIAHALVHGAAIAPGTGRVQRPFAHVRDVARAMIAVLRLPAHLAGGRQFDIVRPRDMMPMAAVTAHIADITGAHISFASGPEQPFVPSSSTEHPGIPGFSLRLQIPDGIRELCRGLSRRGLDAEMLQGVALQERETGTGLSRHAASLRGRA